MNSILQLLGQLPELQSLSVDNNHFEECNIINPTNCLHCQYLKFMNAYRKHSIKTIKPTMLKQIIGQLAKDFNNAKQQDCYEFFTVFTDLAGQSLSPTIPSLFTIRSHYRMQCQQCQHEDETPVDQENCLTIQIPESSSVSSYTLGGLLDGIYEEDYIERDCPCCNTRICF